MYALLYRMPSVERKHIDLTPLKKANVPIFFIVGGPGSGKGTQCERIVAKYGLSHLSSGDLLRDEVKSGSPRGAQLTKIMEAGELVPLEVVLDLIKEAMLKEVAKGSKGFLIDGYPREVKQGEQFENEIQEAKSVIFFDVSEDILVERLLHRAKTSGRADDNMETIKKRLHTFTTATAPVVEYYEKKKKLIRIQAKGTIDEIFAEVSKHLDQLMGHNGRVDDNMETIKKRLHTFTTATAPVVDYYEKLKKLIRIKAQGTIDEIFSAVVQQMDVVLQRA
ncbi:adenylate kinase [Ancylostoma ceylanicum]|uniref:Adenylate kinase isoenzyme 1 n=1 Tax=Ancylostoma ceylanicum TaxID=53326 RepID=A0A0D6LT18_9BILA|nr:adenylate kinase [Ancylostoma ceylanicum]